MKDILALAEAKAYEAVALVEKASFLAFRRNGRGYAEIVPDCSKATLQGIIRGRVDLESIIHSDGWREYEGLVDLGYQKHFRVEHGKNEFANGHSHINGIESFGPLPKHVLSASEECAKIRFIST